MSKDKQLMELITQDIIAKFSQDTGRSIADAMVIFYNSEFFEKLYDAETGLYLEGSDYLFRRDQTRKIGSKRNLKQG